MDFVSNSLVVLSQPTGFWESILNAFKGVNGTYILAVILIALLVRVVFSLVDIINKKVNMKNMDINNKMKPELEAIKKKYGNDQVLMQQKTNEVYRKYQYNMMGSCFPMLIMMILQFTVFLTLWNSLQSVSNYNIASQYEEMKNIYANIIEVNDELASQTFEEGDKLNIVIANNEEGKRIVNVEIVRGEEKIEVAKKDFDYEMDNKEIYNLIKKYVIVPTPETPEEGEEVETQEETSESPETPTTPTEPEVVYTETGFNDIVKAIAEEQVKDYYLATQEGFLWIKNVYKAESPQSPMFSESEIKSYLSKFYTEEQRKLESENDFEGKIFGNVVAGINTESLGVNGYYILTIIAVASAVLSMWLSNFLMRKKDQPKQKQSWAMYVIMPLIYGIFTFMYTSLFAIYLIMGQLAMIALTPLTTWVVKKWTEASDKKKKEKDVIEVDYRRK